jgi:hypothetical protein
MRDFDLIDGIVEEFKRRELERQRQQARAEAIASRRL